MNKLTTDLYEGIQLLKKHQQLDLMEISELIKSLDSEKEIASEPSFEENIFDIANGDHIMLTGLTRQQAADISNGLNLIKSSTFGKAILSGLSFIKEEINFASEILEMLAYQFEYRETSEEMIEYIGSYSLEYVLSLKGSDMEDMKVSDYLMKINPKIISTKYGYFYTN